MQLIRLHSKVWRCSLSRGFRHPWETPPTWPLYCHTSMKLARYLEAQEDLERKDSKCPTFRMRLPLASKMKQNNFTWKHMHFDAFVSTVYRPLWKPKNADAGENTWRLFFSKFSKPPFSFLYEALNRSVYLKHSTFETKVWKISVKLFSSCANCKVISFDVNKWNRGKTGGKTGGSSVPVFFFLFSF